jgi:hypothetical protein
VNKRLFAMVAAAAMLMSGAAMAQGLPFSSDRETNRPWNINRMAPHDMNVFRSQGNQSQPQPQADPSIRTQPVR